MGSQTITEPKRASQNGHNRVVCRECGKAFETERRSDRANLPYNVTVEGPICRNRPECRGRQLADEYEKRGLKRWARHTQEQLLAVMDAPPPNWDRSRKWKSIHLPHERVGAAIEFHSICWPVCLPYAVQCDADGEPIREFGDWKRMTHRALAYILHMQQSQVTRAIAYRKARKLLTEVDERLYSEAAPKLLTASERDDCTVISDLQIQQLSGLPQKAAKLLKALGAVLPPDDYTRIKAIAADARTELNRAISDARTRAAERVFDACRPHASLLSRLGEAETTNSASSSSSAFSDTLAAFPSPDGDDDGTVDMYLHAVKNLRAQPVEVAMPPDPYPQPQTTTSARSEMFEALHAAGLGKGALAKLPSPLPSVVATWEATAAAVRSYVVADDDGIAQLVTSCRAAVQDCSDAEIAYGVRLRGPLAVEKRNPMGFLLTAVPNLFRGSGYQQIREVALRAASIATQAGDEAKQQEIRTAERFLSAPLNDPHVSDEDRAWARQIICGGNV